jgi:hypothetical protein
MHVLAVAKYDDEGVSLPEREFKALQFVLNFQSQRACHFLAEWPSKLPPRVARAVPRPTLNFGCPLPHWDSFSS